MNRIDFFQSEKSELSVAAARAAVFIDGCLCSYLEVVEVFRGGWPKFGWAKLKANKAAYIENQMFGIEDELELPIGSSVCIRRFYNEGTSIESIPVFSGRIEYVERKLSEAGETVEVIARDFSTELERVTVYGHWVAQEDGTVLFLGGADTVFNESGKPNGSELKVLHNSGQLRFFTDEPQKGRFWSYAEVIDYLLGVYLPVGVLKSQPIERLMALTENQKVYDLDVTAVSLLEALHRCCERTGVLFRFVPRATSTGPQQAIVFYRKGHGRSVELNYQRAGERLSISKTNVSTVNSIKYPLVTHRCIGRGDVKRFEATFELVKGWDLGLEDTDYDKFSPSSNPQFIEVKDVYRRWVLNEGGDYSGEPYNQGQAFDFSRIFGSRDYVKKRRRFWPALSCDKHGRSVGYYLEVSFDNGQHWWQYLGAFENRLDECGIWLSSDRLDIDTWVAALKGVLKFRVTASVLSDERLSCQIANGPVNSIVPVVDHIITLPRQFKYRKVTGKSIFANSENSSLGKADEADDREALYECVRKRASDLSAMIEVFDVRTPYLMLDFLPGDIVTSSPESRDLFGIRRDNRSIAWIESVRMDFDKQCTELKIKKQRKSFL